jgi:hypothetical protein
MSARYLPLRPCSNVTTDTRSDALQTTKRFLHQGFPFATIIGDGRVYTVEEFALTIEGHQSSYKWQLAAVSSRLCSYRGFEIRSDLGPRLPQPVQTNWGSTSSAEINPDFRLDLDWAGTTSCKLKACFALSVGRER